MRYIIAFRDGTYGYHYGTWAVDERKFKFIDIYGNVTRVADMDDIQEMWTTEMTHNEYAAWRPDGERVVLRLRDGTIHHGEDIMVDKDGKINLFMKNGITVLEAPLSEIDHFERTVRPKEEK